MNDPIVVTRTLMRRAWTDFEPKLFSAMASGQVAAIIINILGNYVKLSGSDQTEIVLGVALLTGYLVPSSGTTITKTAPTTGDVISETRSGAAVSTITNSIPIPQTVQQATPSFTGLVNPVSNPPVAEPSPRMQNIVQRFGQPTGDVDNHATTVLPHSEDRN